MGTLSSIVQNSIPGTCSSTNETAAIKTIVGFRTVNHHSIYLKFSSVGASSKVVTIDEGLLKY
jgi:hypothetical protein